MTSPAVTVSPDDTVEHAAKLMYSRSLKRLPVVNAEMHLAGIVSRTDVLAVFDREDSDIRKEILDVILRDFLMDPWRFSVAVKDGIVTDPAARFHPHTRPPRREDRLRLACQR